VKYNPGGAKPSGYLHTLFRSGASVYHVKGTSVSSVTVGAGTVTIRGNAAIYDVTTGSLLIDAAASFEATAIDAAQDGFVVSVRNASGVLFFTSNVAGPQLLGTGDVRIR